MMRRLSVFLVIYTFAWVACQHVSAQFAAVPNRQPHDVIEPSVTNEAEIYDPLSEFGHSPHPPIITHGSNVDATLLASSPQGENTLVDPTIPQSDPFYETCVITEESQVWVKLIPYLWATQVNSNLTVQGVTVPMNLDLYDLWKLLEDGEVRGGFMGHLEFGRDNWSIFVNGDIISMDPSVSSRRATIETGLTAAILEMGGAIDVYNAKPHDPNHSPLRVQLLGGARYYSMDVSAILSLPNVNPVVQTAQGEQWVDLFTGARLIAELKPGMNAVVRGDWGGFGIGSSSNKTWNLVTAITMDFGRAANLLVGYRFLDIEQNLRGGTGSPLGFGFDGLVHGPLAGLEFQF